MFHPGVQVLGHYKDTEQVFVEQVFFVQVFVVQVLGQVCTSDGGDELLQLSQQVSVSLKVVEMMLHPMTTHVQHSAGGGGVSQVT